MSNNKIYIKIIPLIFAINNIYFSQSLQELQKLKNEYEKFKNTGSTTNIINPESNNINTNSLNPNKRSFSPYKNEFSINDTSDNHLNYFGYDFFTLRDSVSFWENLPAPDNYSLGSGDELVVSLWGETQLREKYIISKEGKIYDERVGVLNLSGKTIAEAEDYLKNQFGKIYATLNSNKPSTFMDISLGQLRSINVNFTGHVKYPGVYPIHPFSNLINGLIQAGGIDTTGSLRKIIIKRNGKVFSQIDLYQYLINGDLPEKIQLRDQDIVVIPTRLTTIMIDSCVVKPGIYESIEEETINKIINYAGGFSLNASTKISLDRVVPLSKRENSKFINESRYIEFEKINIEKVQNGDIIKVLGMKKAVNEVEIIGHVKAPGKYNYYKTMMLSDLIELGGVFSDTSFMKSVYMQRAELIRKDENSRYEEIIKIDLLNFYNKKSKDILLQNHDKLIVHPNLNYSEKKNLQITGEVRIPGSYPLISNGETLKSLIERSGGLTNRALKHGISIFREKRYFDNDILNNKNSNMEFMISNEQSLSKDNKINYELYEKEKFEKENNKWIKVAWQDQNIPLMPGDSIVVFETTGTVNIMGEVYNPGLIGFQKGKSLNYYVNSAGGINPYGNNRDIIVVYANGVIVPKKFMRSPEIIDGSTIVDNKKELKEPFSITDFSSSVLSIISTTVTILVLSQQLNQ